MRKTSIKEEHVIIEKSSEDDFLGTRMKLWEVCANMANSVSGRRDSMNKWFITLHVAVMGFAFTHKDETFISCIGIALSIIWFCLLLNYRRLNMAKYQVICDIEKDLPVCPFGKEWEILKKMPNYVGFTKIETIMPLMALVIYIIFLILNYGLQFIH